VVVIIVSLQSPALIKWVKSFIPKISTNSNPSIKEAK